MRQGDNLSKSGPPKGPNTLTPRVPSAMTVPVPFATHAQAVQKQSDRRHLGATDDAAQLSSPHRDDERRRSLQFQFQYCIRVRVTRECNT